MSREEVKYDTHLPHSDFNFSVLQKQEAQWPEKTQMRQTA